MSRVGWARTAADDVEGVIGCMLCRENPRAQRVRPAQGDGGIDIYTPDDFGNLTVYQVKSFTGALNASHKRQIRKSWNAFLAFVAARQLPVDAWYLVRPEDPTPNDVAWLAQLTGGAAFRCEWRGLSFCDRLAADHQSVVDYYLRDGKERLQTAVGDLMAAMHSGAEAMTQPGVTLHTLAAIHQTINSLDPHFRYDFRVDTLPLDANGVPVMPGLETYPQGMLAAATSAGPGGRAITYLIYARYEEAISDRPLPGRFTLVAEPGTADAEALQDFYDYGMPLSDITATDLEVDLPGGLGVTGMMDGIVRIGPSRITTAQSKRLQLVIVEGDTDSVVASVDLHMEPATRGLGGDEKFAVSGKESAGVFDVVFRFDPTAKRMLTSFKTRSLTGLDPTDSLPGLYFLTVFGPPYRMQMRYRNGPPLDRTLLPITEPILKGPDQVLEICEALATIQGESFTPIVIPDFASTTNVEADEWMTAARLLRGDVLGFTWTHVDIESNGRLAFGAGDAYNIETQEPLTVRISGTVVDLGFKLFHLEAARASPEHTGVRPGFLRLEPAANDGGWTVWQRETFFPDHIETVGNPVRGRPAP